jgi:ribose-phosphate pyrophosphokinase
MTLSLFAGSANLPLAQTVATHLNAGLGLCEIERFPDGELHITLQESVRGHDVYLLQPTGPPAEAHLLELLLLADASRRAGAARVTAVMPYFGYARQDRRAAGREAVGARVMADVIQAAGIERVVVLDLHTAALEGFFSIPLAHLTAVPLLTEAAARDVTPDSVVVAPDLGAAKLAEQYATHLQLPVAIVHKTRISGATVRASRLTGDVRGRNAIIVDDMISTGGTIEAAANALLEAGCRPDLVVASHGLFVGPAIERLKRVSIRRIRVTDSVPGSTDVPIPIERLPLASLLADAIQRLHTQQSLGELLAHG